jgi:3-methyladenine DNA glycosylase AlkC
MEPLKNMYNAKFFESFCQIIQQVVPSFDSKKFLIAVQDNEWKNRELKQRIRHISNVLHSFLPGPFKNQAKLICKVILLLKKKQVQENSFPYICLPDFIEVYGLEDPDTSLTAMETITSFISCEFAVRPFLLMEQEKVMRYMLGWSTHADQNVRRFSSEGCRPRLPWGKAIPALKANPSPILPILENLKDDPSLFVRKSVANNINDIAKDHPDIVIGLIKRWKGKSKGTDWILKHGSRTLLRKANPQIYKQFGLLENHAGRIRDFGLDKKSIRLGETIQLAFSLENSGKSSQLLRVELGVYYIKSNGIAARKLFKIADKFFDPGVSYVFKRKLNFKDLTTRKHYTGEHAVAIVVNGKELGKKTFLVKSQATKSV